ncbi:HlyD family efflux transporter periplasmic adaptor subunit [Roseibium salinum]|nr:HlyD family efflux transporter periplasmic adaptor subunit [Roseibium salinum]
MAPESVWTLAYVDEARAGTIQPGQPAEVRLRSLPHDVYQAKVARIGIESDRVNEERKVWVKCEQCPPRVFPGRTGGSPYHGCPSRHGTHGPGSSSLTVRRA